MIVTVAQTDTTQRIAVAAMASRAEAARCGRRDAALRIDDDVEGTDDAA